MRNETILFGTVAAAIVFMLATGWSFQLRTTQILHLEPDGEKTPFPIAPGQSMGTGTETETEPAEASKTGRERIKKVLTGEQSEFAPKDPEKLPKQSTKDYIAKYRRIAIKEMHRTGVPASITMAQAIIESANGNSRLARNLNNHFGIKCHDRDCPAGHCMNYADDHHKDFFRKFKTVEQSFKAHSAVVLKERYTSRIRNKNSYKQWAHALQDGGYATGKHYAKKLIRVIEMYKLQELDVRN